MTTSALYNRVQQEIENLSLSSPEDELLRLSIANKNTTNVYAVQTVYNLPQNVNPGTMIFVDGSAEFFIYTSNNGWRSLDKKLTFGDTLWAWGYNFYGNLGDGTRSSRSSPVQEFTNSTTWSTVQCGDNHTVAIKTNGTLWSWGRNNSGQLGDGTTSTDRSSPIQEFTSSSDWVQVSAGNLHTVAIKNNGTLWSWGSAFFGQLANGSSVPRSSPVQEIRYSTNWSQVSAGQLYTTAIKTDGTLWAWGYNQEGQLGDNTTISKFSPVQEITKSTNWRQVSAGVSLTAAIKTDGTLWTWGYNATGQIGDGTRTNRSSPVQEFTASTNWQQVDAGTYYTTAIKTDGTLWAWGQNTTGELGDGTITNRSIPTQEITGSTNWQQVSANQAFTAAIKTDGTLWSWGYNNSGQLGDSTITSRSSPVQEFSGSRWNFVSCGQNHTAAVKSY